jgi:hypothetical protein
MEDWYGPSWALSEEEEEGMEVLSNEGFKSDKAVVTANDPPAEKPESTTFPCTSGPEVEGGVNSPIWSKTYLVASTQSSTGTG